MASEEVRSRLEDLIRGSGEGYAAISRRLGRNPAYIQQFIKRGVPRRLSETDRRVLAQHFNISEAQLGGSAGPEPASYSHADLRPASSPEVGYAAVPYLASLESGRHPFIIDQQFLRSMAGSRLPSLAAHAVTGDSMAPTLVAGDQVLVDTADRRAPRDGIYVIESGGALLVKRLSVNPATRRIAILSDNAAYPSFPDCDPNGVNVVGRVFWLGRCLA